MINPNAKNQRIKHEYFKYLREAKRKSEQSVDAAAKALARFEAYTKHRDFRSFHTDQAIGFKRHLAGPNASSAGKRLSAATQHATLIQLRAFFEWLSHETGYKARITYSVAAYFNLPDKDVRVAIAKREGRTPTLDQIRHVLGQMPTNTDCERRNRALVAFVLLTGARVAATASFKMKHLNVATESIEQDAREVSTKGSKSFTTWFFPVGDEVKAIVVEWARFLREERLWGDDDPLFPATQVVQDETCRFVRMGLSRKHWKSGSAIQQIFKKAFEAAGLEYFHPHSFRRTLVQLGQRICTTPEEYKAWSQNLGHEQVLTTFMSYGTVARGRQQEIMSQMSTRATEPSDAADDVIELLERLKAVVHSTREGHRRV